MSVQLDLCRRTDHREPSELARLDLAEAALAYAAHRSNASGRRFVACPPAAAVAGTCQAAGSPAEAVGTGLAEEAGTARDHLLATADHRHHRAACWEADCGRATPCAPARRPASVRKPE